MILRLGGVLKNVMHLDLDAIHFSLRVSTDVIDLLRAIEKYFGLVANYAKGKGKQFMVWMKKKHPGAYLYAVAQVCGGSRQDLGV